MQVLGVIQYGILHLSVDTFGYQLKAGHFPLFGGFGALNPTCKVQLAADLGGLRNVSNESTKTTVPPYVGSHTFETTMGDRCTQINTDRIAWFPRSSVVGIHVICIPTPECWNEKAIHN